MRALLHFFILSILLSCIALTSSAQLPVANFTISPDSGCAPLVVTFFSTSTGNPTSFEWDFGNSFTSTNPHTAAHTYTVPGTYTVKLKVTNANGTNTKIVTQAVTVLPSPNVNFVGTPLSGCPPLTVNFTDNSVLNYPGPAIYNWNFGTGIPSNAQNPSHVFTIPGFYHVTLNVKNNAGCQSSNLKTQYIHVFAPPVADFTNTPICMAPGTTTFTSTVTGAGPYTYSWDYGDGSPAGTTANPSHTYANSGNYNARLVVTDINGCKDTVIKTVNVGTLNASFNAPTGVICIGAPVHFLNTSTAAMYYMWNFGDGNTSTSTNPTHTYTNAGTFTVTLLATDAATVCTDTFSTTVTVSAGPIAGFNISPIIPCPANDTLFFTNLSTGAVSYQWNFGDGSSINTQTNPYHIYNFDSIYVITLKAIDANGCTNSISIEDTFYKAEFNILADYKVNHCVPAPVQFGYTLNYIFFTSRNRMAALYPYNPPDPHWTSANPPLPASFTSVVSLAWDFRDGSPIVTNNDTPTHVFTSPGTYYVTATAITAQGCVLVDSFPVQVDTLPVAKFTLSHDTICVGDTVYIYDQSTGATGCTYHFPSLTRTDAWTTPPNLLIGQYSFRHPADIIVTMQAFNNTCPDTAQLPIVAIGPSNRPSFEVDCDTPTLVRFGDSSLYRISSRLWEFGDGTTDTSKNPSHLYSSLGNYTVRLTIYDDSTGCSPVQEFLLSLYDPVVDFLAPDTAVCRKDTVFLDKQTSTPISLIGYYIEPRSGIDDAGPHSAHDVWVTFKNAGLYSVKLKYGYQVGCIDSITKTNYILVADPNPNFQAIPHIGCSPLSTILIENGSNTPGAYTTNWNWTFGDNTTASTGNDSITHVYGPGKYNVKVVLTDNVGCVDSLTMNNLVESRNTTVNFVANDTTVCIGDTTKFTNYATSATNVSLTYKWDFGDGSPVDTAKNPYHLYTQTGNYTVTLIAVDNIGCADTLVRPAYIKLTKPNASFTMDDTFAMCPPLIVQFTNNSTGALSYQWTFGDGSNSQVPSPTNIYINPGKYNITLIAKDSYGCTDTAYGSSEVLGYAGGLTYTPKLGCNPLTVNFTANLTNVSNFLWDFSDGNVVPANGSTTTHVYKSPGKFLPKILFTDSSGCVNSSSGVDTIFVDDVIADFTTTPVCINTPITLKDTSYSFFSQVTNWNWNINNGQFISPLSTASANFSSIGTYPVVLIVKNANGCKDTLYDNITILPLPSITASGDTIICVGDAATVRGFGGVSYEWSPAGSVDCPTCQSTTASPTTTTNYIVVGTDINGCKNTDTVKITTQIKTTSQIGEGGQICADSSIQLLASGAQRYEWIPSAGLNDASIPNPVASPQVSTTYMVIAYEGSCIPDTNSIRVIVHPLPTVRAIGQETIVVGNSVNLHAEGTNIRDYLWTPAQSLSCETCSSPIARPTATTTYVITVSSEFGCRASDEVTITVLCDQSQLFIPNTFSPNGDGENDVFYPRGIGLQSVRSFRIYNRWGEMVYERQGIQLNDAATAWDGTYKGNSLNPDVFVYVLEGICDGGETMIWKGDITLIR